MKLPSAYNQSAQHIDGWEMSAIGGFVRKKHWGLFSKGYKDPYSMSDPAGSAARAHAKAEAEQQKRQRREAQRVHLLNEVIISCIEKRPTTTIPKRLLSIFKADVAKAGGHLMWAQKQPEFRERCEVIEKKIAKAKDHELSARIVPAR